jgi:hypothetical protein
MASRQLPTRETPIGGRPAVKPQGRQRSRSPRTKAKPLPDQALAIEAVTDDLENALDLGGDANRDEVVAHHIPRLMAKFRDLREPQRAVVRLRAPPPSEARPLAPRLQRGLSISRLPSAVWPAERRAAFAPATRARVRFVLASPQVSDAGSVAPAAPAASLRASSRKQPRRVDIQLPGVD